MGAPVLTPGADAPAPAPGHGTGAPAPTPGADAPAPNPGAGAPSPAPAPNSGAGARAPGAGASPHPHSPPYRRWGLSEPLAPAPQPPDRPPAPRAADPGLAPVVDRVATRDKVVFLTYDDGAERDPRFVEMVRELRLPVSMFLTDSVVGPGYGHFARLRAVGATVQNHTLDHTALRGLPYAGQRAEICGQQNKLKQRFGIRPTLFRPPYGVYDTTTLRAAADCGIWAVVLWRASMQITDLRYAVGDHLRPGDIVLAQFRGPAQLNGATLTRMTTRLLRRIQEQGLTVGRLEDYL
ncbi:polysaccharide deacetylase family protein [Streptomyces sp. CA-210063]|uniref:polysaccharide deacetylase family protein n=1 Tax=Streptomyces sp. CA-210063 TaxID=2801029 RepID=UPI00214C26EA|nr:polysaccharide deacetylase family protein [Streptomyces sp. CA-210063]UUU31451.1 polysaccharide deacetylase family protein [Streptomyces sp. CA-210063]